MTAPHPRDRDAIAPRDSCPAPRDSTTNKVTESTPRFDPYYVKGSNARGAIRSDDLGGLESTGSILSRYLVELFERASTPTPDPTPEPTLAERLLAMTGKAA